MKFSNSLNTLKQEGYKIATFIQEKTEILIWKNDERWYGYGINQDYAVEFILIKIIDNMLEMFRKKIFNNKLAELFLTYCFDIYDNTDIIEIIQPIHTIFTPLSSVNLFEDKKLQRRLSNLLELLNKQNPDENQENVQDYLLDEQTLQLVNKIRPIVKGYTVLFITNRDDSRLKQKLENLFNFNIVWCEGNPRKITAQFKNISRRSYDCVIAATGFTSHNVDAVLGRAAKQKNIPYIRAGKGRYITVIQALARLIPGHATL